MAEAVQGKAPGDTVPGGSPAVPGVPAGGGGDPAGRHLAHGGQEDVEGPVMAIHATERLPHPAVMRLEQSVDRLDRTARNLEDTAYRLLDARGSFWVHVVGWVFLLIFAPLIFLYGASHLPDVWRAQAAAALLGTTSLKGAAGHILEVADERALVRAEWGEEMIAINRDRLRECLSAGGAAAPSASDGVPDPVTCTLIIPPPPRQADLP